MPLPTVVRPPGPASGPESVMTEPAVSNAAPPLKVMGRLVERLPPAWTVPPLKLKANGALAQGRQVQQARVEIVRSERPGGARRQSEPATFVPPLWVNTPVPELPTYSQEIAARQPLDICTVPLPAGLPSESVPQVSPSWVTAAVAPPSTI